MHEYKGVVHPFQLSTQQEAIIDFAEEGKGDLVVSAGPGSAKTTTAVEFSKHIKSSGLYVAFNKSIADTLASKLGRRFAACTIHSLGFRALKRAYPKARVDGAKYLELAKEAGKRAARGQFGGNSLERCATANIKPAQVRKLFDSLRNALEIEGVGAVSIDQHMLQHGVDLDVDLGVGELGILAKMMSWMAETGLKQASLVVDFGDMLWITHVEQLKLDQYPWVVVDEAQDLSPLQLELVLMARMTGGRMVFVGDPWQAIYGFAGAMNDSVDQIIARTAAVLLPLTICYRCSHQVLERVRALNPEIQDGPNCPEGEVIEVSDDKFSSMVKDGDLVICRRNAPLVSLTFKLIALGVPARMRGRDIAAGLCAVVMKISKKTKWASVLDGIAKWCDKEQTRCAENDDEAREMVRDKAEVLKLFVTEAEGYTDMCDAIDGLFSDDRAGVWLSSVHRAKGLEADRVFILQYDRIELGCRLEWQRKQERHLHYVALSRAKTTLILGHKPG